MNITNLFKKWSILISFFILTEIAVVLITRFVSHNPNVFYITVLVIFLINIFLVVLFLWMQLRFFQKNWSKIHKTLITANEDIYNATQIGIVVYNPDQIIIWANEFFCTHCDTTRSIGKKVQTIFPRFTSVLQEENHYSLVELNNHWYQIFVLKELQILIFKNIDAFKTLYDMHNDEGMAVGRLQIDNYASLENLSNEGMRVNVTNEINLVIAYLSNQYHMLVRSVSPDSYILFMTKKNLIRFIKLDLRQILENFKAKTAAHKLPLSMSMGFSYGINNPNNLFEIANENLKKTKIRGGDQAIVRKYGANKEIYLGVGKESFSIQAVIETKYFGKQLTDAIAQASNILIAGHQWGDYDTIGSCLGVYYLAWSMNKPVHIVINQKQLDDNARYNFLKIIPHNFLNTVYISPVNIEKYYQKQTLFIVCDTHIYARAEFGNMLKTTQNIFVIDHHRLLPTDVIQARNSHIRISASSTSEIVSEIILNFNSSKNMPEFIATLLLTGIILDSNHFRIHASPRTFEIVSQLKNWHANQEVAEEALKFDWNDQKLVNRIAASGEQLAHGVVISCANESDRIQRSMLSRIAQNMCSYRDVDLVAVLAYDDNGISSVSFRSSDRINSQIIAEEMHGGGHYNAAAAQLKIPLQEMYNMTSSVILNYLKINNWK